mmetsp:Transcript_38533/g.61570  ORF Transcript_38533/g.61570 Transcript_38533/m.61570 type:complete len:370 (-) Transcript_38533:156-1265(-)
MQPFEHALNPVASVLNLNDPVVVYVDSNCTLKGIGFVRFIGFTETGGMQQHIGIELIEAIANGHNGIVHHTQFFHAEPGHGILVPITNVIKVLTATEILYKLKAALHIFKQQIVFCCDTIQQQQRQIARLKETQNEQNTNIASTDKASVISSTRNKPVLPDDISHNAKGIRRRSDPLKPVSVHKRVHALSASDGLPAMKPISAARNVPISPIPIAPPQINTVQSVQYSNALSPCYPIRESPTTSSSFAPTVRRISVEMSSPIEGKQDSVRSLHSKATTSGSFSPDQDTRQEQEHDHQHGNQHLARHSGSNQDIHAHCKQERRYNIQTYVSKKRMLRKQPVVEVRETAETNHPLERLESGRRKSIDHALQ